jgi:hypothetical protein
MIRTILAIDNKKSAVDPIGLKNQCALRAHWIIPYQLTASAFLGMMHAFSFQRESVQ